MLFIPILITVVILIAVVYFFLFSFNHHLLITKYLNVKKKSNIPQYIFGISCVVFLGILILFIREVNFYKNTSIINENISSRNTKVITSPDFQQLLLETYPDMQNYYFLYKLSNKNKAALEEVARNIRKNGCYAACTINFYDNSMAFFVDRERVSITDPEQVEKWNKKNYIFVADHYLGYLSSAKYPSFAYFPDKNSKYNELLRNSK